MIFEPHQEEWFTALSDSTVRPSYGYVIRRPLLVFPVTCMLSTHALRVRVKSIRPNLGWPPISTDILRRFGRISNLSQRRFSVMPSPDTLGAIEYEERNVHQVYKAIASHFSSTRYKPWPIVESFLQSQPPGSIGLDVGCGNGRYLTVNRDIFIVGSDRCSTLAQIASQHDPHAAVVADTLALPHQAGQFDFVISIAVVHHFSTRERRRKAIGGILDCLRMGGTALLYVWALEQKASRRGWEEGCEQDITVPWVMKTGKQNASKSGETKQTFQRYYHLYRSGELEEDVAAGGGKVLESGYEKDNWWAICGT